MIQKYGHEREEIRDWNSEEELRRDGQKAELYYRYQKLTKNQHDRTTASRDPLRDRVPRDKGEADFQQPLPLSLISTVFRTNMLPSILTCVELFRTSYNILQSRACRGHLSPDVLQQHYRVFVEWMCLLSKNVFLYCSPQSV
jgi:hypothetical protein